MAKLIARWTVTYPGMAAYTATLLSTRSMTITHEMLETESLPTYFEADPSFSKPKPHRICLKNGGLLEPHGAISYDMIKKQQRSRQNQSGLQKQTFHTAHLSPVPRQPGALAPALQAASAAVASCAKGMVPVPIIRCRPKPKLPWASETSGPVQGFQRNWPPQVCGKLCPISL